MNITSSNSNVSAYFSSTQLGSALIINTQGRESGGQRALVSFDQASVKLSMMSVLTHLDMNMNMLFLCATPYEYFILLYGVRILYIYFCF